MILADDKIQRTIIPNAKVISVGDISYKDNDVVGYDITISAVPYTGENGKSYTHKEVVE